MIPNIPSCAKPDCFNLTRFLDAQVKAELRAGLKRSHWMWFIFPQFAGLAGSAMSQRYAIQSLAEAHAYLCHPVLGARLAECSKIVNSLQDRTARQIFGRPDDLKFHSCMTLFELAGAPDSEFSAALEKYFSGQRDANSLALIRQAAAMLTISNDMAPP